MIDLALVHYVSPGFQAKLVASLAAVTVALQQARRPYVAFSGGKDSLATMALATRLRDDIMLHWSDDELEYPEVLDYMAMMQEVAGPQLRITRGFSTHAGWFTPWTDRPFWREPLPGTINIGMRVEDWTEQQGYDLVLLGTRMEESRQRRNWLTQVGPIYRVAGYRQRRCCPLWDWTADDVWALIAGWRLPYCAAYDVYERIGVPRHRQRIGPLPLAPRQYLEDGWPDILTRLEARYGPRWR
jgi:3'-phosphoadenosine 5'-phosphosulfate sulfotransferase (PAPS reductase)/FAD synthetase